MDNIYLSYSGRKSYQVCPRKYACRYVTREVSKRDPRSSFLGSTAGVIFEWFYSNQIWADPDPVGKCVSLIDTAIDYTFAREKWDPHEDPTVRGNLQVELSKMVPDGIEIIRSNGFLTPYSRAETDLTVTVQRADSNLSIKMGGRSDFIHGQSPNDVYILDGKASRHRDKYVDPEQLIWYAAQHYIKYHVIPSRLGFVFWAFPADPVMWIDFNGNDLRKNVDTTFDIAKKIRLKMFDPTPTEECYRCDYQSKCDDGIKYLARRRLETGGRIEDSIFLLEDVSSLSGG